MITLTDSVVSVPFAPACNSSAIVQAPSNKSPKSTSSKFQLCYGSKSKARSTSSKISRRIRLPRQQLSELQNLSSILFIFVIFLDAPAFYRGHRTRGRSIVDTYTWGLFGPYTTVNTQAFPVPVSSPRWKSCSETTVSTTLSVNVRYDKPSSAVARELSNP
jgi:hypothetical protein